MCNLEHCLFSAQSVQLWAEIVTGVLFMRDVDARLGDARLMHA
jgi:hypothetical protein